MGSIFAEKVNYGLEAMTTRRGEVAQSIRIGISRDANRLLRFYIRDSPFVSGSRSLNR